MTPLRVFLIVFGFGALAVWNFSESREVETTTAETAGSALAEVVRPASLSANAEIGETHFTAKCATCHGPDAEGQAGVTPPLIHKIYEPSHYADEALQRAAALGVPQHHWRFGDMPPVEGLTRGDVAMIVAHIRELQRANVIN